MKTVNQGIVKKVIETAIVMCSLLIAFFVFKNLKPEKFIKPDTDPVTTAQIAASPQTSYAGSAAGQDIPRLFSIGDFERMTGMDYATTEPLEVAATGIYSLKPWVDPYEITKVRNSGGRLVSTGRKAPEVTDSAVTAMEYYQEYYLIRLPDETYILAQFNDAYKDRIEEGEKVTLPLGVKKVNSSAARQYLQDICERYEADDTFTLYMIDDEWEESHDTTFFMIKLCIAAAVFLVLAICLLLIFYKAVERR